MGGLMQQAHLSYFQVLGISSVGVMFGMMLGIEMRKMAENKKRRKEDELRRSARGKKQGYWRLERGLNRGIMR